MYLEKIQITKTYKTFSLYTHTHTHTQVRIYKYIYKDL